MGSALRLFTVGVLATTIIACNSSNNFVVTRNNVEVAEADGSFTTLVAALEASGKLNVGNGHGPVHHFHAFR